MTINIQVPVNGCDLDLLVEGEVYGFTRDEYNYEIYKVEAKYNDMVVFKIDQQGEESGLISRTDLADEIVLIAESLLVQEKFDYGNF